MANEHTTGIIGSQKGRQASATAGRNAQHGAFKKMRPWIIAILTIIVPLLFWWRSDEVQNEMHKVATEQSVTPTATAKWKEVTEDGSIPVGVWSESTMLPPGSKTFFDAGNGTVYQIRYRLYKSEWTVHSGGNNFPPADEIQFKAMKPGLQKIPFTVKQP